MGRWLLILGLLVLAGCGPGNVQLRPGQSCDSSPEGLQLCRSQCDAGQMRACYRLGWFYENGVDVSEDMETAVDYYHKACLEGFAVACRAIGMMLWTGDRVVMNRRKAIAYYRRACGLGLPEACPTQAMVDQSENRRSKPGAELQVEGSVQVGEPDGPDAPDGPDTPDAPDVKGPEAPTVEPPSIPTPSL